ncbi:dehydratase [Roseibium sp. TrichSKD4]|uniref:MaoC family dehydratase n=1 Tax=Roseibium sp. TrichSKD4 TaxID=744980 RepID=UPI0001E5681E|nr:MaoC family dehydratase [Roseibium sp. TrichSKD4]EFO31743.1 dehydratase [Roseibium sp. TrichSKD4]
MSKFLEDYAIGDRLDLGSHQFTKEEIIRFASKYDPQPFHLSEEAAFKTHFGKLCASGWHTASVYMKLLVTTHTRLHAEALQEGRQPARYGPSPGFEDLKWMKPVYAGDTISYYSVVAATRNSSKRPAWGLIFADNFGTNQQGDLVFSFKSKVFLERRPQIANA